MKSLKEKPFALVGVNSDEDREKLKKVIKEKELNWRSFWNASGAQGVISAQWGVFGWPTIYLLDANGVIRYKNVRGKKLDAAIAELLAELE